MMPLRSFSECERISATNDFVAASELGYTSNADQVDILCMAETNLDWATKLGTTATNTYVHSGQSVKSQRHLLLNVRLCIPTG
jgi:hypothetical protein